MLVSENMSDPISSGFEIISILGEILSSTARSQTFVMSSFVSDNIVSNSSSFAIPASTSFFL